jgi:hypothetical protein
MLQLNEIMFSNGMLEVFQEGNGNVLLENGSGLGIPMKIEQRGGMKIADLLLKREAFKIEGAKIGAVCVL